MNGSFFARALAFVLLVAVIGGLGVLAYNAGVSAGVTQTAQVVGQEGQPISVVPYAYGPYWHGGGFGFFNIFIWIIGFFLIIGLLRAIFGWGSGGRGGWGRSGWGRYGFYGPGGPYGGPGGSGAPYGPDQMDRVSEWHRELHRRDEAAGSDADQRPPAAGA